MSLLEALTRLDAIRGHCFAAPARCCCCSCSSSVRHSRAHAASLHPSPRPSLSLSDFGHRRDVAVAGIRSWRTPTTLHDALVRRRRTHAAVSLTTHPHLYPVALRRRSPYSSQKEKAVKRGGSLGRAARRSTLYGSTDRHLALDELLLLLLLHSASWS